MIKAITFDLWDTVFIDDSDEPKRKVAGRPTKAVERRLLVRKYAERHKPVSRELVDAVFDAQEAAYKKIWHDLHVTWKVRDRLEVVMKGLDVTLADNEMSGLVRLLEEMELEFRPDFVPGVHEAIERLSARYQLGVISDAIYSPGRALRKMLEDEGLLKYFSTIIFSDEAGCSKPAPCVFEAAKQGLGVEFDEIVHVGDREHNDILGPEKMEMHSILCLAAVDRRSDRSRAGAWFDDYARLPAIIEEMDKGR